MKSRIHLFVILIILSGTTLLSGQPVNKNENRTRISLETDPVTFIFNGYAAHIRLQPASSDHILAGAGIYAMDLPDALVNFNEKNRDKNWNVRIRGGYGLFGEYHFSEVNRRFFVGTQAGVQRYRIGKEEASGESDFTNALLMGYGGYTLQPFSFPLYLKAWAGAGYTSMISGSNTLGTAEYDIAPVTLFGTLHLGYTF